MVPRDEAGATGSDAPVRDAEGAAPEAAAASVPDASAAETCDYCGSTKLSWRKCKLICQDCAQINKSCADL